MKQPAITVKQPWASLIVEGIKDIENRTWKCPQKYIGKRVLIHSSQKPLRPVKLFNDIQKDVIKIAGLWTTCVFPECGAIIGSVEIVDCVINHPSIWAEKSDWYKIYEFHPNGIPSSYGCRHKNKVDNPIYNWVLANPIKFEKPIPCKGKLSFWEFDGEVPNNQKP